MSNANRGRWAEAQVREVLLDIEKRHFAFSFKRIPDAHGGFMQPAEADFQWRSRGRGPAGTMTRNGLIEVKEVEHLSLLPHKNFSTDKIARMWKEHMAGAEAVVLVAHKLKGMRKPDVTWRACPLDFFRGTTYVKGVASWDLSLFPLIDMPTYLRSKLL